jgi:hypothetical protein
LLAWDAIVNDDHVGKIRCHDKVVFDDKRCAVGVCDESLDDFANNDALLRVQVPASPQPQQHALLHEKFGTAKQAKPSWAQQSTCSAQQLVSYALGSSRR